MERRRAALKRHVGGRHLGEHLEEIFRLDRPDMAKMQHWNSSLAMSCHRVRARRDYFVARRA
jgi:hypothetical protein